MKYCFPISGNTKWFGLSITLSLNSGQCTLGDKWREELRFCVAFAEKNIRCRDIRTRLAEKKRSWREIQRRGEIGAKCGHPTPLYETHRLDFIVIVGPFTSSSFSLLSNSSPLFLFGVDFHFGLVNKWQRWEKEGQIGALKWMAVIILLIVGALVTTTLAERVTIANQGGGDCQYSCKAIAWPSSCWIRVLTDL